MIQTLFGSVEQEPSLLEKLKSGVQKTRAGLVSALEDALQGKKEIDADLLDELESTLISADIGVRTTEEILDAHPPAGGAASTERRGRAEGADPRAPAGNPGGQRARAGARGRAARRGPGGGGQRLGQDHHHRQAGRSASGARGARCCCARPIRSARRPSSSSRSGASAPEAPVIRQSPGSDPSAVLFDALQAARARKVDYVIVDTAGPPADQGEPHGGAAEDEPHRRAR